MNVCVSVLGRFHAFDLARELAARGSLGRLVTSYPRFAAARFGVPRERVTSVLAAEVLRRGWTHLPDAVSRTLDPRGFLADAFDRRAARAVPADTDVFVGWSGSALTSLLRARDLGATAIVERGSTHMLHQQRVVRAEHEEFGLVPRLAHPAVVERELAEYERADFIAVPSRYVKRTFVENGVPEEKLLHVPYGVSLDSFRPPEPGAREAERVFRVLHVGSVSLRKGCHYLLEAFRALDLPRSELWFVGPVAPEMEPFRERWSSDRIVFHEPVPQARLREFYGRASVFALASIEEGLAMVIAQAMATGLPVVAADSTGAEDLVRDGTDGFVLPARDAGALADRLRRLYEDREGRLAMGRAARERVSAGHTWSDYGERCLRAYARARRAGTSGAGAARGGRAA